MTGSFTISDSSDKMKTEITMHSVNLLPAFLKQSGKLTIVLNLNRIEKNIESTKMASKNDLNASNIELDVELDLANEDSALVNEDSALPIEDPDLPIEESSSPNGYFASTNVESVLTNGSFALANSDTPNVSSVLSNGHSAITNGSLTNGTSVLLNGHGDALANGAQSNGNSSVANGEPDLSNEEDFITRQEHVHDRAVQVLLQNWPVSENVKQRFEEEKIDYNQLASLNEEDLEMLGVEDEQTRKEMVVVFSQLANQNDKKYQA